MDPLFLTLEEVLEINLDQVRRYGGTAGVRDEGLLLSALAMPQAGFGDRTLSPSNSNHHGERPLDGRFCRSFHQKGRPPGRPFCVLYRSIPSHSADRRQQQPTSLA